MDAQNIAIVVIIGAFIMGFIYINFIKPAGGNEGEEVQPKNENNTNDINKGKEVNNTNKTKNKSSKKK